MKTIAVCHNSRDFILLSVGWPNFLKCLQVTINDDFGLALVWSGCGDIGQRKFPIDVEFTSSSLMAGLVGVMAVLLPDVKIDLPNWRRTGTARF